MKRRSLTTAILFAASLAMAHAAAASTALMSVEKIARSQPRIVNGLFTSEHATTGQLLSGSNPNTATSWCSGTMIGCNTFLTAAHCVEDDTNPNNYQVFLQHAGAFGVSSIRMHPNYNFPVADVAVLKLSNAVTGIAPTPINTTQSPSFGTTATIAGFGRSGGNNFDYGLKRYGAVTTASCAVVGESNTTSVCWEFTNPVGAPGTDSNTCNADSGGPLFVDFGAGDVVAGITSGGIGADCTAGDASFDTNVYHYRNWIEQQAGSDINNTSCGTLPQIGEAGTNISAATGTLNNSNRQAVHSFQVPPGTTELRVSMNSIDDDTSNFDLYVRQGSAPTTSSYDCKADGSNHIGYCNFSSPSDGTWYLLVDRKRGSGAYQTTATTFGGGCQDNTPCDDGNSCTRNDICLSGTCSGTPVANGTSCDDGNSCTATDSCQAGVCRGSGSTCGDGIVQSCEQCDDGNDQNGDSCNADCTLPEPEAQVDAVVLPIKPLKVKVGAGNSIVFKTARAKIRNAGEEDTTITLTTDEGTCPTGTIFSATFKDGATSSEVRAGKTASVTIELDITDEGFDTTSKKSPARCTAEVRATASGADVNTTNDASPLVIDVYDRNDY